MQRVQWYRLQVQLNRVYEVIVTAQNSEGESSKELVIPTIIGNVSEESEIRKLLIHAKSLGTLSSSLHDIRHIQNWNNKKTVTCGTQK